MAIEAIVFAVVGGITAIIISGKLEPHLHAKRLHPLAQHGCMNVISVAPRTSIIFMHRDNMDVMIEDASVTNAPCLAFKSHSLRRT